MSDDRRSAKRRNPSGADDWGALFEHWSDAPPSEDFADRVLAACDASVDGDDAVHEAPRVMSARELPRIRELASARLVREVAPPRSLRGGVLLIAAVAAALLLIPLALRRGDRSPPPAQLTIAAGPPSYDLGPTRD